MDPSNRGSYRSASNRDDGETQFRFRTPPMFAVIDPSNYNNYVYRGDVGGAPARRRPEIDLNNPAKQEEDTPVRHAPVVDAPVQHDPVDDDYTGSNYDAFYENAHPPTPVHSPGETGFDLNAAVREAQERDEAYCQERLENLRKGKAMEDQFLDMSFRNSSPAAEDGPGYYKLWND